MGYFESIKNGELPDIQVLYELLQNPVQELEYKDEINRYIEVLKINFNNSLLTEEKILINNVLFVLETLIDLDSRVNFIDRVLEIYIDEVDKKYIDFVNKVLDYDIDLFSILSIKLSLLSEKTTKDLRTFFNWCLVVFWNHKNFHMDKKWTLLYEPLKNLIYRLKDNNRIADMMYVEFFTYHIMGNQFQTIDEWREFNEKITKETTKAYKKFNLSNPNPSKKAKKRIAFVMPRVAFNSPFIVEYSLFKHLMNHKEFIANYEIIVYSANYIEKSDDRENLINALEQIGVKYKNPVKDFKYNPYYNDHLQKAIVLREAMIKDEIDIMIAGGVFPILNFLYVTRTAPLQIYYSHGNCAFDIEGIDKRISHFNQECKEFEWNIINVPFDKQFLIGSDQHKQEGLQIKSKYNDKIILGTIGRLVKLDSDEYLQTISKIMQKNPNTIYLACGAGNKEVIKEKLKKYDIDEERFIFTGLVNAHIYGYVIDIWPETFPLIQGNSRNEFEAKGGAIVGYKKYYRDEAIKKIEEISKELNIPSPLANNLDEFVEITTNLINNTDLREKTGELYKKLRDFYSTFDYERFKEVIEK